MNTALVLILIPIVLAIIAWAVRPKPKTAEPLKLKLSVVGFKESGKTVFVGSMFNELKVPDEEGIYLHTSPEYEGKLLDLYNITADTNADFPASTAKGAMTEYPFTLKVRSVSGVANVAEFSYLDFAGESLSDMYKAPNPVTARLYERFKASDVLMAALDGFQVKSYMENRPEPDFHRNLGALLTLLSDHQKAISLILTKWDILEERYTLQQIVERLLEISQFAKFVRSQRMLGTCRLIPVSSVGSGFVVEQDGRMVKVQGRQINPAGVELPIACALPGALAAAQQQAEQQKADSPARSVLLAWAEMFKIGIGPLIVGMGPPREGPAQSYFTYAQSTPDAITQLLQYCGKKVTELERQFPQSDLVRFINRQGL